MDVRTRRINGIIERSTSTEKRPGRRERDSDAADADGGDGGGAGR